MSLAAPERQIVMESLWILGHLILAAICICSGAIVGAVDSNRSFQEGYFGGFYFFLFLEAIYWLAECKILGTSLFKMVGT
jgi:hypothetical protein